MRKIVVGYDSSDQASDALRLADSLRSSEDGELIVASIEEAEAVLRNVPEWLEQRDAYYEANFAHASEQLGRDDFTRRIGGGSVPAGLDQIAECEGADVIVVGSTHRGRFGQVLPGSVGERLLAGAPCAVAIAPIGYGRREHPAIARIGVAYDGQPEARAALWTAIDLARHYGAELEVIAVTPTAREVVTPGRIGHTNAGYTRILTRHFEQLLADGVAEVPSDVDARAVRLSGDPAREIAAQGLELDLLILGSRGYGPVRRTLLGGVARDVITLAPCPVVVLPRSAGPSPARRDEQSALAQGT
jgi:nucleotide-binding universal stress UspA family protein